ncbi:metallophosphoesterase family protein [Polyangium sp. 6x1]|uniref:metallophosphoesterase family protein n=1 Tax=Polyangium sp. 6x1 TaxID=3042689 RepID=UPI0024831355|nr:metallophosphoesterase family protein [Polyangium sp. 6x1]MDI1445453.1 metallophosphoesterase family protein [Polyangium sp. 6x1]
MSTLAAPPRLLAALGIAASLASGCSDPAPVEPPPPPPTDDRCPGSGVSKGPWSLRVDRTSAVVRWEACRQGVAGGVVFTPEGGGETREATSTVTTYEVPTRRTAVLDPSAPADEAGTYWTHEAVLSDLTPGACVEYHLAADPAAKGRVCAAKPDGADLRFLAIGDTNPGLNRITLKLLDQVLPMGPDFTLHGGDIQYYESGLETYASWFPAMRPLLAQGAMFPALGNHELEVPEEYEAYYRRFFGGAGFDGEGDSYRFESGGVWFFSLDTEKPLGLASEQGVWLAQSLADAASKPGYRFSVVFLHKPLVTCGDKSEDPATRAELEPLFVQHGVRLVIQAHMHGYERFAFPDITWITTGGGGASLANVDENVDRPICAMRAASGTVRHAVVLDATGKTLSGQVIDDKGAVWDTFTLEGP